MVPALAAVCISFKWDLGTPNTIYAKNFMQRTFTPELRVFQNLMKTIANSHPDDPHPSNFAAFLSWHAVCSDPLWGDRDGCRLAQL